jgi:hypothetical protein
MTKLYDNVIEILDASGNEDDHSGMMYEDYSDEFAAALAAAGITIENTDHHGGEGQGDDFWTVYHFTRDDEAAFVKFSGWYASYSGAEYDETFEVTPEQVMATVYKRIRS